MSRTHVINTDCIRLRNIADDSPAAGQLVQLLPEGGTAPGDLITLTADSTVNWQYNFPAGIVNGTYDLWVGGNEMQHAGETLQVRVMREGKVTKADTTFVKG